MTLLFITLKVSLVVGAGLVAAITRRGSAALRHWLLAAAIASAAAIPVLAPIAPPWHLPRTASHQPAPASVSYRITSIGDRVAAPTSASAALGPSKRRIGRIPLSSALRIVWIAGVFSCLASLAAGLSRLRWIASHAGPVTDATWRGEMDRVSTEYAVRRGVALLQSDRPALLVTWGFVRPQIILPTGAQSWPADRVRVVLSHELAHIARGDWPLQMLAELVRSFYWFNPVMWLAAARLRQEGEHACDDAVLNRGIEAPAYARQLVDLARAAVCRRERLPAQAMVRPSSLERRIRAMLNATTDRAPVSRRTRLTAAAGFAAATIALAGFGAAAQDQTVLSGMVVDATGRPIASPSIVLTSADDSARHAVRGDKAGRFEFVALPSATYALAAEALGFAPLREQLTLSGASVRRTLSLHIATVQESIRVTEVPAPPLPPQPDRVQRQRAFRQKMADRCAQAPDAACLEAPIKLKDVKPVFPPSLAGNDTGRLVHMRGVIGVDGFIHGLQVVGEVPADLSAAANAAVSQWEFEPTRLDGQPVETAIEVTVLFAPGR